MKSNVIHLTSWCRQFLISLFQVEVAPKKEFLLFSTLFDASIIDSAYKEKEVYFEITMGKSHDSKANSLLYL